MKTTSKKILIIALLVLVTLPLMASWSVGDFSFSIAPGDPLFKESRSNPFSNSICFHYMKVTPEDKYIPNDVLAAGWGGSGEKPSTIPDGYYLLPFDDFKKKNSSYYHMKVGVNTGVLRFSWKNYIQTELYLHGGINTVFTNYGGTDALGFDGMYGLGVTLDVCDIAYIRFGLHHFSGHWGDEIIAKLDDKMKENSTPEYNRLLEYTRNNSYFMNISIEPMKYFRIMAEAELPLKKAWIRPSAHIPQFTQSPSGGDLGYEHNQG